MKQTLQLKMGQQLTMTPQLQQAIRLLQLSTLDLQSEIQEALDSNPMLEVSEEGADAHSDTPSDSSESYSAADSAHTENSDTSTLDRTSASQNDSDANGEAKEIQTDTDWTDTIPADLAVDTSWDDVYQSSAPAGTGLARPDSEDYDLESRRATNETLQDHLIWQLNLTPMSRLDQEIAMTIIDAVEPNGMLCQTAEEIFNGLCAYHEELELEEVFAVLHRVQQFDPVGIAAQNISECLLIQMSQLPEDTPELATAKTIAAEYLEVLGSRDFKQLLRKLKIKETQLQQAIQIIHNLNPRPGEQIESEPPKYVVPDVFVSKTDNRWQVQLNPDIAPKIRINSGYASLVKRADSSSDNTFLRDNLQEAKWFLKSLQSRNETLLKVATCIVEKQQGFLDNGPESMKPMVLHDVAEIVEMHESTISRVTTQKYMHTPQGIFELKYFFSSHVATDSGGECSSTAIRAIIKKLVAAENPKKPLSDSKITGLLTEQGIKVARRTIAKYRESLLIPPSNERKQLV